LRKFIRERALGSNLLNLIGHAKMEKEIQNTVTKIIESQDIEELHRETGIELDGNELRRYIDVVVSEVKKITDVLLHR
jgi:flagellar basal body-associated protein FliL